MKRRMLSVILVLAVLLSLLPVTALAEDREGTCRRHHVLQLER